MQDTNTPLETIAAQLPGRGQWLATAESCTGGGIGQALTSLAGSSGWYCGGVISYSNELKRRLLSVSAQSLNDFGAVSEPVAREMAAGVAALTGADYAVATTGIAGPDGGSVDKPVGTVWFGFYALGQVTAEVRVFAGDRAQVRAATVDHAIARLVEIIDKKSG